MFTRIYKAAARYRFCNGLTVYMCACNLRPEMFATPVNVAQIETGLYDTSPRAELFERAVNACNFYNCLNAETGRRVAFYIKEGE